MISNSKLSMAFVRVAITLDDSSVAVMSFITFGQGSACPPGAEWITREDGSETGWWYRSPTDENVFREISKTFAAPPPAPQASAWRIVKESEIPADRTFRNALRDNGKKLSFDMPTAREIHLGRIRNARARKFVELDAEWMRAMGTGDEPAKADVESRRQQLRDLPQTLGVEKAKTVDELKALRSPLLE